jgi:hypothetical protein
MALAVFDLEHHLLQVGELLLDGLEGLLAALSLLSGFTRPSAFTRLARVARLSS